ncbi:hypothetical protein AB1K70_19445 [Bremerella sp. JC770]|uniref:hypothetical protein n=1 Tax=Bremerella sp. JC770 TaxID=3232137 RepID=UPI003457CE7E
MGKAAVGFRDGALAISWHQFGTPRTDGMTDALVVDAATKEDALAAYDAIQGTDLAAAEAKRREVETKFAEAIAAGYDTGLGFAVKIEETDQRFWMDMFVGLQSLVALGQVAQSDPYAVKDVTGAVQQVTVQAAMNLALTGFVYVGQVYRTKFGYESMLAQGMNDFEVDFTSQVDA